MSKLIDVAVSHFSSQEVRSLEVPQWQTTVYSKSLSMDDKAKWLSRSDGDTTDYMIYSLIYGVTDEKGEPIFDLGDKAKLRRNVDPDVISTIANFVLKLDAKSEEDREKNS